MHKLHLIRTVPILLVAILVLAGPAAGSKANLAATGVITGTGPYSLTVTNTGDETIYCVSLDVPTGVTVTGVSGPGRPMPVHFELLGTVSDGFLAANFANIGEPGLILPGGRTRRSGS